MGGIQATMFCDGAPDQARGSQKGGGGLTFCSAV